MTWIPPAKPTVVLVHGAFADASSWNRVVKHLQSESYPVLAPANPVRGVPSDSAYISSVLSTVSGPIVLVGHSYGGAVITNAAVGNTNVMRQQSSQIGVGELKQAARLDGANEYQVF